MLLLKKNISGIFEYHWKKVSEKRLPEVKFTMDKLTNFFNTLTRFKYLLSIEHTIMLSCVF